MESNQKKKKWMYAGAGVLLATALGTGWFFFGQSEPDDTPGIEDQIEVAQMVKYMASYTENGVVTLYDVENEAELDAFDLKTLATGKEVVLEEKVKEKPKEEPKVDVFKDFEVVPIVIKKSDNTWNLQTSLTPDRNIFHMLPLLSELNEGKPLHPIYPNETRLFLKEKGDAVPKEEPKTDTVVKKTVKKVDKNAVYIYFKDVNDNSLYAYNDIEKAVYKLSVVEGKWKAEILMSHDDFKQAEWLYVEDGRVWLADKDLTHIQVAELDGKDVKTIETKGEMSKWAVEKDTVFYTYDNRMMAYQLSGNKETDIVVGDETVDFVKVKDKFYVLNSFGKKSDNSILLQVNPSDMRVDSLMELKSDQTAILSHSESDMLYVGKIEKTKSLNGEVIEEPKVLSINLKTLSSDPMNWELVFAPTMMGWSQYLYSVEDDKVKIYRAGDNKPTKEFPIKDKSFTLIPK